MITVHFMCDDTDLIPTAKLSHLPRVGEHIAIEDVVMIGSNPTVRVRWFDVKTIVHHIALATEETRASQGNVRGHGISMHLEYRHG